MIIRNKIISVIYFLGIGGIGMSALARYFHFHGIRIAGYDRTVTPLTRELESEGMTVHYHDSPAEIPADTDLVIYTPAIPKDLQEFIHLAGTGIPMVKRAEVLGMISFGKRTIALAGTHGKTSMSALTAHILMASGAPVTALIGGISKNYNTNFIHSGKEEVMVLEADEYDRSFLQLKPDIAVISSMDPDHLDIYGHATEMHRSFHDFADGIKAGGRAIIRQGLDITVREDILRFSYGVERDAEYMARELRIEGHAQYFDLTYPSGIIPGIRLQLPGRHNVENAVAAAAVCMQYGMDPQAIASGIASFTGVRRRFDFRIKQENCVYIDDYAHHPRELEAFIHAVRSLYPGKKITGMFQPHLFSRTRDFAEGFAHSLDLLDETWLLDIYPARELPIAGITSELILNKMKSEHKFLLTEAQALERLERIKPELFLTIGAGDIDQLVEPVEKILNS
jgi:UDP-N-acetylmuramate--alanine ligase